VENSIAVLADYIGPHKIMWATDYPHQDGFFPGAPKMMRDRLESLSTKAAHQVMAGGALGFYGMSGPERSRHRAALILWLPGLRVKSVTRSTGQISLPRPQCFEHTPRRLDDVLVAGAAAQVRRQELNKRLVIELLTAFQRADDQHQKARCAETAL